MIFLRRSTSRKNEGRPLAQPQRDVKVRTSAADQETPEPRTVAQPEIGLDAHACHDPARGGRSAHPPHSPWRSAAGIPAIRAAGAFRRLARTAGCGPLPCPHHRVSLDGAGAWEPRHLEMTASE